MIGERLRAGGLWLSWWIELPGHRDMGNADLGENFVDRLVAALFIEATDGKAGVKC